MNYSQYLWIELKIIFKKMREYKADFYFTTLVSIINLASQIIFLLIFYSHFGMIVGWGVKEFVMFTVINELIDGIGSIFIWKERLGEQIKSGTLNKYLYQPGSVLFKRFFSGIIASNFIFMLFSILFFILALIYFSIIPSLSFLFYSILIIIFYVLFVELMHVFEFHHLGSANVLMSVSFPIYNQLYHYPSQFFKKMFFKNVLFLFPLFFTSALLVPELTGVNLFLPNIKSIFLEILVGLAIIYYILWKYGLKRYNAVN